MEFAFGRLDLITTQVYRLGQVGRNVLIGACSLMTYARRSIDSPRARGDRLHACRHKWQLAVTSATHNGASSCFTLAKNFEELLSS